MASNNVVTIGQKYGLPPFSEEADFEHWLHEIEMWQVVTELNKSKQGPVLYLSLNAKIRQQCASLTKDELNKDDGLDKLINKLRDLYAVTEDQAMYNAYERFETFHRSNSMGMTDYINEFEQLNQKLVLYGMQLPSAVLAYQLLKNANLPKDKRDLARVTVNELTYNAMKKQIKAIHDVCAGHKEDKDDMGSTIKVEADDHVFYSYNNSGSSYRGNYRGNRGGNFRGGYRNNNQRFIGNFNKQSKGKNPFVLTVKGVELVDVSYVNRQSLCKRLS